jgi:DNA polymerase-1
VLQKRCEECPLKQNHGKAVPVFKDGHRVGSASYTEVPYKGRLRDVDIVVVGESPGGYELYRGSPFVGDTGQVVDSEFRSNGIDPATVFFANACRCMLFKEDKTSVKTLNQALSCCRPPLERALKALCPKLIVCFGDVALRQVTKLKGITGKRGKLIQSEEFNCLVMPTFHPAACFRDQAKFAFWRPDMALVGKLAKTGFVMPANEQGIYRDADSIRFLLERKNFTAALDTETQGKDWADKNSVVISYSVTTQEGEGYNVWLCQECENASDADYSIKWPRKALRKAVETEVFIKNAQNYEQKIAELRELCERPDIKLVMHNGNYDLHRLRQLGINRDSVKSYTLDTQLAAHALDPDLFIKASLLDVQSAFANNRADHKTAFKQESDISDMLDAGKRNPDQYTMYACGDTDATYVCASIIRDKILKDKRLANYYARLAHPVQSFVLYDIEKNGICFDYNKLPEVKVRVADILLGKEQEFLSLVPQKVLDDHRESGLRLSRPRFLADVFFGRKGFKLEPVGYTQSGSISTDRKFMIRLRDKLGEGPAKEALSLLIEWGPYQRLYTTYLKGFEAAVKSDGRLHTQITKCGTATGRTASSSPNLQNIPKRNKEIMKAVRSLLYAPDGRVLVAVDYSQSELRWIAHESGDTNMLSIFQNNQDMHVVTGKDMARKRGLNWNDMSEDDRKKYRQDAKPVNFGLPYGQSAQGFLNYARDSYGAVFTLEEAKLYRNTFLYESYPGLVRWHEARKAEARKNGFVRSVFGFIRRTPNIRCGDSYMEGEAERIAINTGIQSASNDATLLGSLEARMSGLVDDNRAKLELFIHDELIYSVQEDYVDYFVPRIIQHLENIPTEKFSFKMRVPLVAEASIGKNLAEMLPYRMEKT